MVNILYSTGCTSCRKTIAFFRENSIDIKRINIMKDNIGVQFFKDVLSLTENGFHDIISTRSKYLTEHNIDIDDMSTNEVIQLIIDEPSVLKRPIMFQYTGQGIPYRLQVGYNIDDIKVFLREKRKPCSCIIPYGRNTSKQNCSYKQTLSGEFKRPTKEHL